MMETNGRAGGRLRLGRLFLQRCSLNWNLKDGRLDMCRTRVRIFETVESVCTKRWGNQELEVFEEELLRQSQQIRGAAWNKMQFLPWPWSPTLFDSCFPLTSSPPTVHATYFLSLLCAGLIPTSGLFFCCSLCLEGSTPYRLMTPGPCGLLSFHPLTLSNVILLIHFCF